MDGGKNLLVLQENEKKLWELSSWYPVINIILLQYGVTTSPKESKTWGLDNVVANLN